MNSLLGKRTKKGSKVVKAKAVKAVPPAPQRRPTSDDKEVKLQQLKEKEEREKESREKAERDRQQKQEQEERERVVSRLCYTHTHNTGCDNIFKNHTQLDV